MAKVSDKEIKLRRAKKALSEATPLKCAQDLYLRLSNDRVMAAIIGLSIAEILKALKNDTLKKEDFAKTIIDVCNIKQVLLHDIYPNAMPKPYNPAALMIIASQLMANANLVKGLTAQLVPTLRYGKVVVDIHTEASELEATEEALAVINSADSAVNIFNGQRNFGQNFAVIAINLAAKIVGNLEKA